MERLLLVVVVVVVAVAVAAWSRRRTTAVPVRTSAVVPRQLDRTDFGRPSAPWLVVAFSSASCRACAAVWRQVVPLADDRVAVQEVEARADADLHRRYGIDTVPLVVIADADGVVVRSFLGPTAPGDIAGQLAALRA